MKKIITLALAAAFTVASYAPASALEVTADGEWLYQFQTSGEGFEGQNTEFTGQRVRLGFTFTASEDLHGYTQFEMEDIWGDLESKHGNKNVVTRQLYLDWKVPNTDIRIRMGRHAFDMPAYATCSPIITDWVNEGIVAHVPFNDTYSVTGFWARAVNGARADGEAGDHNVDFFGLVGNASFDNLNITPYVLYGNKGETPLMEVDGEEFQKMPEQSNFAYDDVRGDLFIAGAGIEWKPADALTLALDGAYGKLNYSDTLDAEGNKVEDQSGWYVAAKASYDLDFGTPALLGWYASGDDEGENKHGQLPHIFGDYDATNTYFNAAPGIVGGHSTNVGGTWGVAAQLNGLSFIENLTHDLSIAYIGGTNDKANGANGSGYDYLTTEDSAIELSAVNTLELYKNLSAIFEAAYIIEDYDTSSEGRKDKDFENDWRLSLTFAYTF